MLTVALTGGGFGYLLLSPELAWIALVSLPLMLIWVPGMGLWLSLGRPFSQASSSQPAADHHPGSGRPGDCAVSDPVTVRHGRPPGRLQAAGNTLPRDQPGDGDVHPVSITAARYFHASRRQ